jgi:succinate dehydrogenase / fumarate reductase iron-sulfur subunit
MDLLNRQGLNKGTAFTRSSRGARAFPVIRDLIVNRSAFDRIIQSGGFITVATGSAPDANAVLVPKEDADTAFDAVACIGCGACVAACPNAAAMLFTSAKVTHLNSLPQGQPQRDQRTLSMVATMRNELFGSCTNHGECEAVCPKQIPLEFIGKLNRDLIRAVWHRHREPMMMPSIVQLPSIEDSHEHFDEHVGTQLPVDAQKQVHKETHAPDSISGSYRPARGADMVGGNAGWASSMHVR